MNFLLRWVHRRTARRNSYIESRERLNDALRLAAQVGKPQAAGLRSDRTRIDRRAHVIQIARTK